MEQTVSEHKITPFELELANLLYTVAEVELSIEELRKVLSENEKFNSEDAFAKIDRFNHGYLNISDIIYFFSLNHIPVLERECFYLYNFYCTDPNKGLPFLEFLPIITPQTDLDLRDKFLRRASNRKKKMPFFIEDQLALLLQKEVEYFKQTETLKMNLMHKYGWNSLLAFNLIDVLKKGNINYNDVNLLMKKAKKNFEKDQYKALMRRFDHDANEVITKNEFCESILPNDVKTTDNLTAFKEIEFLDYFETPFKKTQELIYNKNNNDTLKRKYLISHAQPLHKDEDNIFNQSEYRPSALKYLKDYMVDQKNVIEIDKEIYIKQQSPLKFQTSLPEKQEINWKLNSNNAKSFKEILKSTPKKKIFETDKNIKGLDVQNLMESVTHYEKIETEKSMKNKSNFKYLMNYETKNIK